MYKSQVLDNNVSVITHSMKERQSVGVGILVGTGGRYESDKLKGAAHFLEHILFKGSKKYTCEAIKESIEGVGGSLNAFTTEEITCYYAKIPAKHLNNTFDILADMVLYPLIKGTDVAKESTVIQEEIKMYRDLPQYFVMELLDGLMWPNHPLGKNLAGTPESVAGIKNMDLKGFHRKNYIPDNIVVSACGQLDHKKFISLVKKKMSALKAKPKQKYMKVTKAQSKPKCLFHRKEIEQMHLALGMPALEYNHCDRYVLSILNIILGGNMSSRLFDSVREKHGLAYSIGSSYKCLDDTGMFLIRAGVDNEKIVEALELILKELTKIKKGGVTAGEFKRAKDYLLGQVSLALEDTLDHMLWLGEDMSHNMKPRTIKDVISQVKKVKQVDIKRLATEILDDSRYNLAIVGPLVDSQEKKLRVLING